MGVWMNTLSLRSQKASVCCDLLRLGAATKYYSQMEQVPEGVTS